MEFRKMITITLYTIQQKRHWCIEQSYGLCGRGRGRGWEDLGEWHWNMYSVMCGAGRQARFDARSWMLGAGALGRHGGVVWGGRGEVGSGWGAHVCLWRIHLDVWQNPCNVVEFKNKIKLKQKKYIINNIIEQNFYFSIVHKKDSILLPSHGQRSLEGYSPRGCKRFIHNLRTKQQYS